MVTAQVPQALVDWTTTHVESKIVFLLALNVILLIVGTVMDIFSAIVVVLPLVLRIAHAYHIDPYHLGVIFLLNLEVGYLHPPVGLNLFITSVKFQRPITEVMWATVPFLLTMIVALLTITYVPPLTVVPDPERTGTVHDLVVIVDNAFEELRAAKSVTLVAADGTVLQDDAGKPIVVAATACAKLAPDQQASCQNLFFAANECKTEPKPDDCTHKKIAAWAKLHGHVNVVREIPLVTDDDPAPGRPVKDKAGNPIVMKLADCDAQTDSDKKDACHELFDKVSGCKIDPEDKTIGGCTYDVVTKWVGENPP